MTEETDYIQEARNKLAQIAHPDSPMGREIPHLKFDARFRKMVSNQDGTLNYEKAYARIGVEEQELTILRRVIQWGLTQEEVQNLVKYRYRTCLGPEAFQNQTGALSGINVTLKTYPKWCQLLGIAPDPKFPDWGDREEARKSLAGLEKQLEDMDRKI